MEKTSSFLLPFFVLLRPPLTSPDVGPWWHCKKKREIFSSALTAVFFFLNFLLEAHILAPPLQRWPEFWLRSPPPTFKVPKMSEPSRYATRHRPHEAEQMLILLCNPLSVLYTVLIHLRRKKKKGKNDKLVILLNFMQQNSLVEVSCLCFCFLSARDRRWCNGWPGCESKWIKVKETNGSSPRWKQSSSIPEMLRVKWYSIIWHIWGRLCSKVCYFIPHIQFEVIPDTLCTARVSYCHGVTRTHKKLSKALKYAGHTKGDCHHMVEAEILSECFWTVRLQGGGGFWHFHFLSPSSFRDTSLLAVKEF